MNTELRDTLRKLQSDLHAVANRIEGVRQAHATRGGVDASLKGASLFAVAAAQGVKTALAYLTLRAQAASAPEINTIDDLAAAMQVDATSFPDCPRCGLTAYECGCTGRAA